MRKHRKTSSIIWSVILISLGGIFLMDNFEMLNFHLPEHWLSWKLIFVFIAVNHLVKGKVVGGIFWGVGSRLRPSRAQKAGPSAGCEPAAHRGQGHGAGCHP